MGARLGWVGDGGSVHQLQSHVQSHREAIRHVLPELMVRSLAEHAGTPFLFFCYNCVTKTARCRSGGGAAAGGRQPVRRRHLDDRQKLTHDREMVLGEGSGAGAGGRNVTSRAAPTSSGGSHGRESGGRRRPLRSLTAATVFHARRRGKGAPRRRARRWCRHRRR